jgi:hypothetical protein
MNLILRYRLGEVQSGNTARILHDAERWIETRNCRAPRRAGMYAPGFARQPRIQQDQLLRPFKTAECSHAAEAGRAGAQPRGPGRIPVSRIRWAGRSLHSKLGQQR